jgi:hypothetical protein
MLLAAGAAISAHCCHRTNTEHRTAAAEAHEFIAIAHGRSSRTGSLINAKPEWHVACMIAVLSRINPAPDRRRPQLQVCAWSWGR